MVSPLSRVPSDALLEQLHTLVQRDNHLEVDLLAHIGEVDARRLYLREACSSMFSYCVRVLHFSESVAYKRIAAARAARRHPELLDAVRRGDLHATAVSLLAGHLDAENPADLIEAARHKTAAQIRVLLADRQARPDVATSVRRAPTPGVRAVEAPPAPIPPRNRTSASESSSGQNPEAGDEPACAGRLERPPKGSAALAPALPVSTPSRTRTEPLGSGRYLVRFTADRALHEQLVELRALMRHQIPDGDLGKVLARAVAALLKQVRKQKFGESGTPRPAKPSSTPPSRHIPAGIRRAVSKRDGERCTFVSKSGRRCEAREFLEFHHHQPWARTPGHEIEGISLRCRAHNHHEACRDFGERHMAQFRGGASPEWPAGSKSSSDGADE